MKKYWVSILLVAIAVFAIVGIIIWPDYKDVFSALVAVSIPTAILSIEMSKNNERFKASIELERINSIRSQGARFLEALNDNEFVKLNNSFIRRVEIYLKHESCDFGNLIEKVKPIFDKLHIEWLKLEMLIPNDDEGKKLKDNLLKLKITNEKVLEQFQHIVLELNDLTLLGDYDFSNFNNFISRTENIDFNLKRWVWENSVKKKGNNVFEPEIEFNEKDYSEPNIYYIGLYVRYLLDTPRRETAPDGVEKTAMNLISDYCYFKEKEL